MWKYYFRKSAQKFLNTLDRKTAESIESKVKDLSLWLDNKDIINIDIKKLKGSWSGFYRIRTGVYRIIIQVKANTKEIYIYKISKRGAAY